MNAPPASRAAPLSGRVYRIALCSGEQRKWRYLGVHPLHGPSWMDCESGMSFAEANLAYAWEIIGESKAAAVADAAGEAPEDRA